MGVTVSLAIAGTNEDLRWVALIKYKPRMVSGPDGKWCCPEGHYTPEAAAAHGLEISTAILVADARSVQPPAIGALALQRHGA